jgi:virginiamycin B lyase
VRFQLEGLEDRCLLSGISGYTEYPIPSGTPAWYITKGPAGNLWFTETGTSTGARIGMLDPTTHAISEFPLPNPGCNPREITAGADGNIWFTEFSGSTIGMINPTTHAISEFTLPTSGHVWGITTGPDGNIWYRETQPPRVGMINVTTDSITQFAIPNTYGDNAWAGITAGPDGNLWFTVGTGVGDINPTTHSINLYSLPTAGTQPYDITASSDGRLWFTENSSNQIGTIDPTTHAIAEFVDPAASTYTYGITSGPDGNIWFGDGHLGRANPSTGAITSFPVTAGRGITTGPDGNLWLSYGSNILVATLSPSETDLVVTQQPPASVTAGSPFGLTVTAEDGSGNVLSSFDGTVTIALANNPGGATLGGTLTANAINGVTTFSNLTLTKAASGYTLVAGSGLSGEGFTSAITVAPAAASQLVITTQPPSTVKVSTGFGFQASIEDQYGNVVPSATNTVKVAFAKNPTGAALGGTLSVTASQGVATFAGLTINKTGSGYTFQVTSNGLSSAVTNAINVTKNGASSAIAAPGGSTTPSPLLAPLVLDSPDLWDGLRFEKRSHAT